MRVELYYLGRLYSYITFSDFREAQGFVSRYNEKCRAKGHNHRAVFA